MSPHEKYALALSIDIAGVLAVIAALVVYVVIRRRERAQARAFRADQRARANAQLAADLRATPDTAPAVHVEATEAYADELHAAGQTLPSADLRTTGEQMIADHAELAGISDAIDLCGERIMHELRLFLRDDTEYARIARWGTSVLEDTGTFNRRDLDRALAGAVA